MRDEDFEVVLEPEIKMETLEEYLDLEGKGHGRTTTDK